MAVSLIWWQKPEYPEKTTDLPEVTGFVFLHLVYRVPSFSGLFFFYYPFGIL
jgi:hypothetical protein